MSDLYRYYFRKIVLEHNHLLTRSPRMTRQMSGHKMKEPVMDDMINIMQKAKIGHVNVMNVLRQSIGGSENLNLTERDIQNR